MAKEITHEEFLKEVLNANTMPLKQNLNSDGRSFT
jgi:hypothetical protein